MMVIQLILIAAILYVLISFLSSRNSSHTQAWKKIALMIIGLTAIVLILSPNLLDGIAHLLGVGRGADLLLYVLTVAFVFQQLSNYIKTKEEQKKIVILARKIAISEALANLQKK
jgi:hypothetical protein